MSKRNDPWKTDKRPRFPRIVTEVLEEKKETENEGIWKPLLRENEDLKNEVREKEEELKHPFSSKKRKSLGLDDLI